MQAAAGNRPAHVTTSPGVVRSRAPRLRAGLLSLVLGLAAAAAAFGLLARLSLGPEPQVASSANPSLAARAAALDELADQLDRARAKKPPELPDVPTYPPVKVGPASRPVRVVTLLSTPTTLVTVREKDGHKAKEGEKGKHEREKAAERRKREAEKDAERKKHEAEKAAEKKKREEEKRKEEHG